MILIPVNILEYTNMEFPRWVRFCFSDAYGKKHFFNEKLPIVLSKEIENLPSIGYLRGTIMKTDKNIVTIDTSIPDAVESDEGETIFNILR